MDISDFQISNFFEIWKLLKFIAFAKNTTLLSLTSYTPLLVSSMSDLGATCEAAGSKEVFHFGKFPLLDKVYIRFFPILQFYTRLPMAFRWMFSTSL